MNKTHLRAFRALLPLLAAFEAETKASIGHIAIIGHSGERVDPGMYEAQLIAGMLEGMDDDTIGAVAPGVLARSPTLQSRASQLLSPRVLSAIQRRPAGLQLQLPRPSLAQTPPGDVGFAGVPFNLATLAGGATGQIVVQPQSIFKPYKLVVDPLIAPFFVIQSLNVGTVPLFDAPGESPATNFPPTAVQGNLKKITVNPGLAVTLILRNRDGVAHPFFADVFGEAAPVQCG